MHGTPPGIDSLVGIHHNTHDIALLTCFELNRECFEKTLHVAVRTYVVQFRNTTIATHMHHYVGIVVAFDE